MAAVVWRLSATKTASHVCSGKREAKYVGQMFQPSHSTHVHTQTYALYVYNLPPKMPLRTGRTVARLQHTDNALLLWSPNVVSLCLIVP